jgi:hypothetical protein
VTGILERVGAFFFEAAEAPARVPQPPPAEQEAPEVEAAVVGPPAAVVPVAAACAGELRARADAAAALVCTWRPPASEIEASAPAARSPAGATTRGARRLAARLAARDLDVTACGRLAWLALDPDAAAAAGEFRRCRTAVGVPLVLAIAGPRREPLEPLLAELDLCVAVLPADIDPALRELAVAGITSRSKAVVPPLPPGPPRWAAMAGLARLRSLSEVAS